MPELPEIELYLHALRPRIEGEAVEGVRIRSPYLLRTFDPPISAMEGKRVLGLERLGKRVVWALEDDLFAVFHLMVTGRFKWRSPGATIPRKGAHGAFDFPSGTLLLTEAGTKKRASLHLVQGRRQVEDLDPGGVEPLETDLAGFREALLRENRTLKRALAEIGEAFPEKITAFHPAMVAHGKFGEPCPVCSTPIQRIVYESRETNYCPTCQTGGKLLADRSLSRLLREDWPRTLEELEELKRTRREG
jgi:formamidopyrimidine-DNA glycosylase